MRIPCWALRPDLLSTRSHVACGTSFEFRMPISQARVCSSRPPAQADRTEAARGFCSQAVWPSGISAFAAGELDVKAEPA
jgi:hypothetical protein